MDDVALVRSRVDIVHLVSERVQLKRTGKSWTGLCPFHDDKKPSFTVNAQTGWYRCWSCGAKGDCFNWVMETQKFEFREALEFLAKQVGVELSNRNEPRDPGKGEQMGQIMDTALGYFREALAKSTDASTYLTKRGITPEVAMIWEIGYAPDAGDALAHKLKQAGLSLAMGKELFVVDSRDNGDFYDKFRGRLMFPIRDERGKLVAFGGRALGDGHPKYINSGDTPLFAKHRVLYGMNRARDAMSKSRRVVLTEGYLDAIACHRAGIEDAVASLGTAFSEEHARLLKRWVDHAVILYDADAAGEKAAARASEMLEAEGIRVQVALMARGADPDTLLRDQGPKALHAAVDAGIAPLDFQIHRLEKRLTVEQPEFWEEAVETLSASHNALEVEKHLVRLASKYPDLRDPVAAQRALQKQIAASRRARRQKRRTTEPAAPILSKQTPLDPREAIIFRALLEEEFRAEAWRAIIELDLWLTGRGFALAESLNQTWPEGPPEGTAAAWLPSHPDPEVVDQLTTLESDGSLILSHQTLGDALTGLRERRELRDLVQFRANAPANDNTLTEITERLKRLKKVEDPGSLPL